MPSHGKFKRGCIVPALAILISIVGIVLTLSFSSCETMKGAGKAYYNNPTTSYHRGGYTHTYGSDGTRYRTYTRYSRW